MTSTTNHQDQTRHDPLQRNGRHPCAITGATAIATLLALAALAAGCGSSNNPGAGSPPPGSTAGVFAKFVAYARCMRSHGVPDFPDPTTSPGRGVSFQISGGPGSDLNKHNPTFEAAEQACRPLLPGPGQSPPAPSPQRIAAEVTWAKCMRAHGLPSFPDPNNQGAFDSSKFDDNSPTFQTASNDCKSQQPSGSIAAVAGHG
jgi:hypothetical protein